jgi:hypothetical protein
VTWPTEEIAKFAISDTDICRIDISVDLPSNFAVRNLYFAKFIGYISQIRRSRMFVEVNAFFFR